MSTGITVVLLEMLQWQLLSPLRFAHLSAHSFALPLPAMLARMFCTRAIKIKSFFHICGAQFFKCLEGAGGADICFERLYTTYIYSIACYFTNRQRADYLLFLIYTFALCNVNTLAPHSL